MKNRGRLLWLLAGLCFLFSSMAQASCSLDQGTGIITSLQSYTMPLSGVISVPADTPVGKEIYRQRVQLSNQGRFYVTCTSSEAFYYGFKYQSTPLLPSGYSSTVYETGIPGIGIKFTTSQGNGEDFPALVAASSTCGNYWNCAPSGEWSSNSWLSLVKTANITTSGTIEGSNLPVVLYSFGQSGSMLDVYKVSLSGSLQITSPTCNITTASQSMTVNMGKHDIDVFTGKGATTEWKDASIRLTNCGRFYGNSQGGNDMATFNGSSVVYKGLNNNYLSITLTPLNGFEDAAKGIMKIKDQPLKASGVGIQLSSSESISGLVNLASPVTQTLPKDGTQSITVPLYARYIQTENIVTAGKADGRLEYVITYQ